MSESEHESSNHSTVEPGRSPDNEAGEDQAWTLRPPAVDQLIEAYEAVRESHEPMVVVLSGPSGHGKTRMAQSLHGYLTGRVLGNISPDVDAELAVERARKDLTDDAETTDPAVWLAAACGRLANGERIHAAFSQLSSQVNELTRRQEAKKQLAHTAFKIALSATTGPATEVVSALVEYGGFGQMYEGAKAAKEVVGAVNPLEQANLIHGVRQLQPTEAASSALDSVDMERELNEFGGRFDMLLRQEKPVVVLLDDAQDVDDESLIALTRALIADVDLEGNVTTGARRLFDRARRLDIRPGRYRHRPVLIIITTWEHSLQTGAQSALGDWLQGVRRLLGDERVVTLRSPEHFGLLSVDDAAKVMRQDLKPFDVDGDGLVEAAKRLASGKGVNPKSVRVAAGRLRRRLTELPMVAIERTQAEWLASLSPWVDDEARRWYSELGEARVVVQAAALLGETFDTATVVGALALDHPSDRTRALLARAANLQFISPVAERGETWEFAPGCHQVALEDAGGLRSSLTPRLREALLTEIEGTAAEFLAGEPKAMDRWNLLCGGAIALRAQDQDDLTSLMEMGRWAELAWRTSGGEESAFLGQLLARQPSMPSPVEAVVRLVVAKAVAATSSRPAMEEAAAVVMPVLPVLARRPRSLVSRQAAIQLIMALPTYRLRSVRADLLPILVVHAAERPDCALAALNLADDRDRELRLDAVLEHVSASPNVIDPLRKAVRGKRELRWLIAGVAARGGNSPAGIRLMLDEGNQEQRASAVRSLLTWTLDSAEDPDGWDDVERQEGLRLLLGVLAWTVLSVGERTVVVENIIGDPTTGLLRLALNRCDGDQRSRVWAALVAAASTDEAVLRYLHRQARGVGEQQDVTRLLFSWADSSTSSAVLLWRSGQPDSAERTRAVAGLVRLALTDTDAGIALLRVAPTAPEAADVVARIRSDGLGNADVAIRLAERSSDRDALGLDETDVARLRTTLIDLSHHDKRALVALARLDQNAAQRAETADLFAISLKKNPHTHYHDVLFSLPAKKVGDYHDPKDLKKLQQFLLRPDSRGIAALHLGRMAREVMPATAEAAREGLRRYAAERQLCAVALAQLARTQSERDEAGLLLLTHLRSAEFPHRTVAEALLRLHIDLSDDVTEDAANTVLAYAEIGSAWQLPRLLELSLSDQMRGTVNAAVLSRSRDDGDCAVAARRLARTDEERQAATEAMWRCAAHSGAASQWLARHGDDHDLRRLGALGLHSFQPALALLLQAANAGTHVGLWERWRHEPEVALLQMTLGVGRSGSAVRQLLSRWGHRLFPFIAEAMWDRQGAFGRAAIVMVLDAGGAGLRELVHARAAVDADCALFATAMKESSDQQVGVLIEHAAMDVRCRSFLPHVQGYQAQRAVLGARLAGVGVLGPAELVSLAVDGQGLMTAGEQEELRNAAKIGCGDDVLVRLHLGDSLSSADIDRVLLHEPADPDLVMLACQRLTDQQSAEILASFNQMDIPVDHPGPPRLAHPDRTLWSMLERKAEHSPLAAVAAARVASDDRKKRTARRLCAAHARAHFGAATEALRLGASDRWLTSVLCQEGKRNPFAARWLSRQRDRELSDVGWTSLLALAGRDVVAARILLAMVRQYHHSSSQTAAALEASRSWVGDDVEVTLHQALIDPACLDGDLGPSLRGCLARDYPHVVTLLLSTGITVSAVRLLLPEGEIARSGLAAQAARVAWNRKDAAEVLFSIVGNCSPDDGAALLETLLGERPKRRSSPHAVAAGLVLARRSHDGNASRALLAGLTPEVVLAHPPVVEQLLLCQHEKLVPASTRLPRPAQLRHVLTRGPASNRDVIRVIAEGAPTRRERDWLLTAAKEPATAGVLVSEPGPLGQAALETLHAQGTLGGWTVEDAMALVIHGSAPQVSDAHRFLVGRAAEGDSHALNRAYRHAVAGRDERSCQEFESLPVFLQYLKGQTVPAARQRSVRELLSPRALDEPEVAVMLLASGLGVARTGAAAVVRQHLIRDSRGTLLQLASCRPVPSRVADVAVDWAGWPAVAQTLSEMPDPTTDVALLTVSAWLAGGLPAGSEPSAAVRRRLRQSGGDADATAALILIDDQFARALDDDYASGSAASDLQVLAMGEFASRRARVNLSPGLGLVTARALAHLAGREPSAAASVALLMRKHLWPRGSEGETADQIPPVVRHSYSPLVQAELLARKLPYDRTLLVKLATMHQCGGRAVVEALRARPDSDAARELMALPEGGLPLDALAALLPVAGRAASPAQRTRLVKTIAGRRVVSPDLWFAALDLALDDPELAELGRSLGFFSPGQKLRVLTLLAETVELDTLRRLAPLESALRSELVDAYRASPSCRAQWLAAELVLDMGRRAGNQLALKILRGLARESVEACLTLLPLEASMGARWQIGVALQHAVRHADRDDRVMLEVARLVARDAGLRNACGALGSGLIGPLSVDDSSSPERLGAAVLRAKPDIGPFAALASCALTSAAAARVLLTISFRWSSPTGLAPAELERLGTAVCEHARRSTEVAVALARFRASAILSLTREDVEDALRGHTSTDVRAFLAYIDVPRRTWSLLTSQERELLVGWAGRRFAAAKALLQIANDDASLALARGAMASYLSADLASCVKSLARGETPVPRLVAFAEPGSALGRRIAQRCVEMLEYSDPTVLSRHSRRRLALWSAALCRHHLPALVARVKPILIALLEEEAEPALSTALLVLSDSPAERTVAIEQWSDRPASLSTHQLDAFVKAGGRFSDRQLLELCDDLGSRDDIDRRRAVAIARAVDAAACLPAAIGGAEAEARASARRRAISYLRQDQESAAAAVELVALTDGPEQISSFLAAAKLVNTAVDYSRLREILERCGTWESSRCALLDGAQNDPGRAIALLSTDPGLLDPLTDTLLEASATSWVALRSLLSAGVVSEATKSLLETHRDEHGAEAWAAWLAWSTGKVANPRSDRGMARLDNIVDVMLRLTVPARLAWAWADLPGQRSQVVRRLVERAGSDCRAASLLAAAAHTDLRWVPRARAALRVWAASDRDAACALAALPGDPAELAEAYGQLAPWKLDDRQIVLAHASLAQRRGITMPRAAAERLQTIWADEGPADVRVVEALLSAGLMSSDGEPRIRAAAIHDVDLLQALLRRGEAAPDLVQLAVTRSLQEPESALAMAQVMKPSSVPTPLRLEMLGALRSGEFDLGRRAEALRWCDELGRAVEWGVLTDEARHNPDVAVICLRLAVSESERAEARHIARSWAEVDPEVTASLAAAARGQAAMAEARLLIGRHLSSDPDELLAGLLEVLDEARLLELFLPGDPVLPDLLDIAAVRAEYEVSAADVYVGLALSRSPRRVHDALGVLEEHAAGSREAGLLYVRRAAEAAVTHDELERADRFAGQHPDHFQPEFGSAASAVRRRLLSQVFVLPEQHLNPLVDTSTLVAQALAEPRGPARAELYDRMCAVAAKDPEAATAGLLLARGPEQLHEAWSALSEHARDRDVRLVVMAALSRCTLPGTEVAGLLPVDSVEVLELASTNILGLLQGSETPVALMSALTQIRRRGPFKGVDRDIQSRDVRIALRRRARRSLDAAVGLSMVAESAMQRLEATAAIEQWVVRGDQSAARAVLWLGPGAAPQESLELAARVVRDRTTDDPKLVDLLPLAVGGTGEVRLEARQQLLALDDLPLEVLQQLINRSSPEETLELMGNELLRHSFHDADAALTLLELTVLHDEPDLQFMVLRRIGTMVGELRLDQLCRLDRAVQRLGGSDGDAAAGLRIKLASVWARDSELVAEVFEAAPALLDGVTRDQIRQTFEVEVRPDASTRMLLAAVTTGGTTSELAVTLLLDRAAGDRSTALRCAAEPALKSRVELWTVLERFAERDVRAAVALLACVEGSGEQAWIARGQSLLVQGLRDDPTRLCLEVTQLGLTAAAIVASLHSGEEQLLLPHLRFLAHGMESACVLYWEVLLALKRPYGEAASLMRQFAKSSSTAADHLTRLQPAPVEMGLP